MEAEAYFETYVQKYDKPDNPIPDITVANTANEGFIFWLDIKGKQPVIDPEKIEAINPLDLCFECVAPNFDFADNGNNVSYDHEIDHLNEHEIF